MMATGPKATFRDERLDKLAGTRGKEADRALLVSDLTSEVAGAFGGAMAAAVYAKSAVLGADVALTVSGQWYDGPFIALPPGSWLVLAQIQHRNDAAAAAAQVAARIWNGSAPYSVCEFTNDAISGNAFQMSMSAVIVLRAPTVLSLQAMSSVGSANSKMKATAPASGAVAVATRISAMRFGGSNA